MRSRLLFGVAAAAAMIGAPAVNASAIIDLQVEGGGDQQVYQLDNGNLLGLWGFDNRQGDDDVTLSGPGDITGGFTSGGNTIQGYYDSGFQDFAFPFTVNEGDRLFDSLWIEWSGDSNLVYSFNGQTRTMGTEVSLEGDPTAEVPEPGMLALLGAGLLGLLAFRRRGRA